MNEWLRRSAAIAGLLVLAATAGSLLEVPSLASSSPSQAAPVRLRVGTTVDLGTDNPFADTAGNDYVVSTTEYDMLLKFADEDLSAAPSLATGCSHSSDYMTWTCTLRSGLKWSDGTPLTSSDVAFSYRFVIEHHISQYVSYFKSNPTFETPDPTTLVWKADRPTFAPQMPPWVYIVPEHVWAKYQDADLKTIRDVTNTPAVGSGPFVMTSWTRGQGWSMDANPYFWGPKPSVQGIDFRLYSNQQAMIQALKNGEIDIADGIDPNLSPSLQGASNVTIQKVVSDWWLSFAFNFGGQGPQADPLPALHDLRVRQAIEMAIDKEAIVQKVYAGDAAPGDTIIRPASVYWHLSIPQDQQYPYDPAKANQILDEAGYVDTDGNGIRNDPQTGQDLTLFVPASEATTGAVDAGRLIVGYLKRIGIHMTLQPASDAKMSDYWGAGNFDAYIWYWSGDPDPNYQLFVFTSAQCGSWEDGCWKDPRFDQLYDQQGQTMDRSSRLKIVQEAERLAYQQIPDIVLAYPNWLEAYRSDRFTGWVGAPGVDGYLVPQYNYDSFLYVHPVRGGSVATPGSVPGWIWLLGLAAVIGGTVLLIRRGRRRELGEV